MKNILEIKDLRCKIENDIILENVNLSIPEMRVSAVFGDSGSGKTTFLRILSLLFREEAAYQVEGEMILNSAQGSIDILQQKKDLWKIRRRIVYLSQTPNPLNMSIYKNTAFPLLLQGEKDKDKIHDKVINSLKEVNLYKEIEHRLNSSAFDLSGGQKQKLCIARALTLQPDVILMDEPTSSLDTSNKKIIEDLIIKLGRNHSIIVVSHDKEQIKKVADEYFECKDRKIEKIIDI
ncbi:MAG: phosphate ABC transporter ATP-binding protein [Candidatus Delongbacteria bacterium]|jgi:phosphate transport system ATP-binding protein|nr:phosphate ABC transporter ATP-binding protein [Candidatus Delongbacteria bacterium]